jgi:dolichol-phosphate mannosyltransferase
MSDILISAVLPIYNEEKNISELINRLTKALSIISEKYEIIFAADPCTDNTENKIKQARSGNHKIKMIVMSRRFGQQAATLAGIKVAKGQYIVILDSDLQDPPELIPDMYQKIFEGFQVVHARRVKRLGEKKLRLVITHIGYWLINRLSYTDIPRNVGEFKIMTRKFVYELLELKEYNIFLKGLVSYVGYKQGFVDYVRDARFSGEPHYSQLWGSIPLSLNGIICYSNKPLQVISLVGILFSIISFILMITFIIMKIFGFIPIGGLATVLVMLSFFCGLILFSIGILGEYIGRMFDEVKGRPSYIIEKNYLD